MSIPKNRPSFMQKSKTLRPLYLQLFIVTLAFTLLVIAGVLFITNRVALLVFLGVLGTVMITVVWLILIHNDTTATEVNQDPQENIFTTELAQLIIDSAPIGTVIWDKDYKILNTNNELVRYFGLSDKKDFINRFLELTPEYQPDGRHSGETANEFLKKAFEDGYYRTEYVHHNLKGEVIPCEITLVRINYKGENYVVAYSRDLRDEKRMLADIHEANEFALTLYNSMPLGGDIWDKDSNIVDCNQEIVKLFEVEDKEEFIRSFLSLSPEFQPDGTPTIEFGYKMVQKTFAEGRHQFEVVHLTKSGEPLPVLTTCIPVTYKGEKAAAIYVQDLREIKAMMAEREKAVEEKDALVNLSNILNALDEMIYAVDPDTDALLFINNNMKNHYKIEGDCIGQLCYKVLRKDIDTRCGFCQRTRIDKDSDEVVVWEEYNNLTNRFYRKTDRYIDWPTGKRVHLQHSIDITDLKSMTISLDKRLEQQSLVTRITQDFLSGDNLDEIITEAFCSIGEFMGVSQILLLLSDDGGETFVCKNEWLDPKYGKVSHLGDSYKFADPLMELLYSLKKQGMFCVTSDDPRVREAWMPYRRNFHYFLVTCLFQGNAPYLILDFAREEESEKWNQNEINMVHFISNLLSNAFARHTAEEELIRAKEYAEQSSHYKTSFLANMSHEIRTPMNAILGIAEIQLQNEDPTSPVGEALGKIYESGNLLLNIINDILDLSKIEAGKLEIQPVKYDIPSLISDTVQLNILRYDSKPIELHIHVDENTPLYLYGDVLRIKQVLNNILSNAFKYTEKGEIELSVWSETRSDNEEVMLLFRVSDTGQGMTENQIEKLFDAYTRFNLDANREIAGTGLGMNITKRLLDLMDGEIDVKSEVNKGSVFIVKLPQKYVDSLVCGSDMTEKLSNYRYQSTSLSQKNQMPRDYMPYGSVLVVDDVESNAYVAKGMLVPYGLQIETVSSGFEAIEKVKSGKVYDIIFMDHMMPKMDGIEATKIIRDMGYNHVIIALTANALVGQAEKFLKNGFDAFVSKPIDSRELNSILIQYIRNKKSNKKVTELERLLLLDVENAVGVLEDIYSNLSQGERRNSDETDMEMYEITVHGMKSALANVNETELSDFANRLERAKQDGNYSVIRSETPIFIGALKSFIQKLKE